jgi:prolyl-tRNA editing enzyme YbaK/EbsC (Cys-tRNA(Pro) deacylase)
VISAAQTQGEMHPENINNLKGTPFGGPPFGVPRKLSLYIDGSKWFSSTYNKKYPAH